LFLYGINSHAPGGRIVGEHTGGQIGMNLDHRSPRWLGDATGAAREIMMVSWWPAL